MPGPESPSTPQPPPQPPSQPPAQPTTQVQPVAQAQPQAPPKRNRSVIVIIVIVAVLVLLTCCCSMAAFMVYSSQQQDALAEEQAMQVIEHMNAADEAASELEGVIDDWASDADPETPIPLDAASAQFDTMHDELKQAEAIARDMRDSEFKDEILVAIDETENALDLYESALSSLGDVWELAGAVNRILVQMEDASDKLGEAVKNVNEESYAQGKKAAQQAKAGFVEVAAECRQLAADHPETDAEKLAVLADKSAEQAEHVIKQGELGPTSKVSEYNEHVKAYNALNAEIADLPLPDWFLDDEALLGSFLTTFDEAKEADARAEAALERARQALREGKY